MAYPIKYGGPAPQKFLNHRLILLPMDIHNVRQVIHTPSALETLTLWDVGEFYMHAVTSLGDPSLALSREDLQKAYAFTQESARKVSGYIEMYRSGVSTVPRYTPPLDKLLEFEISAG